MRRTIILQLTSLEARAMTHALGSVTTAGDDDMLAVMTGSKNDVQALLRAQEKLDQAIRVANRPDPRFTQYSPPSF